MKKIYLAILVLGAILNGCKEKDVIDTSEELPQVSTSNPTISDTSIILSGEVTFTDGDDSTIRGVCWSESPNPTTNDHYKLDNAKGMGAFSIDITTELKRYKTYYAAVFVENSAGLVYGEEISFNTGNINPPFLNLRGCLECDNYAVGDTFNLDGTTYTVADRNMLDAALVDGKDLSKYCTSKIVDMTLMFGSVNGDPRLFNQDIGNWDVSNVTKMNYMFSGVQNFNQDIGDWDVSSVVIYKEGSFSYSGMGGMFYYTTAFNQDLTKWCVSNLDSKPYSFSVRSGLSSANHPVWGTCP